MQQQTKFKETEIGKIPEDWDVKKLGDIVNFKTGKLDSNFAEENGIYPFFTCAPEPLKINSYSFDCEAILLAGNNANGIFHTNYYNGKFDAYQRTYVIAVKNNIGFLKYLLYQLNFRLNYLKEISQGTATKFLTMIILSNLKIPLPPFVEQQSIAAILSSLDEKIELNQQMSQTLEAVGQAIFRHWFIDFEFPNEEGKPYRSSGGEMVESELGEIPKGWYVKPIDEIAEFLNGLALQKYPAESEDEYLPVIKIRELKQGVTESSDRASVNLPVEYVVEDGDILFSWSGSLEVVIWASGKGALNQHLFKVSSKKYPKWLYYHWVLKYLPEYRHIAEGKATTMGHIQRHHLKSSLILVPDAISLQRMNDLLSAIIERIVEIKVESRKLSQIRDSILPKLMTGKIRVQHAMA